jgi:hypothetical protein
LLVREYSNAERFGEMAQIELLLRMCTLDYSIQCNDNQAIA